MSRSIRIGMAATVVGLIAAALHVTRPDHPASGSDCEAIGAGLLRQPANSLSALALVVVGVALAAGTSRSRRFLGAGVAVAGVASALAHATLHPVAVASDAIGIGVALVLVGVALVTASAFDRTRLLAAGAVATVGVTVWAASRTGGPLCEPDAILGGHAAWHLLAAGAAALGASGISDRQRKI